jgi:hypothetical protein
VTAGSVVDARHLVYYSMVTAKETQRLASLVTPLRPLLPKGWNGVIAPDADRAHFLLANFRGSSTQTTVSDIQYDGAAPVFYQPTVITDSKAAATFSVRQNNSLAQPVRILVKGTGIEAQLEDETSARLTARDNNATVDVSITVEGQSQPATRQGINIKKGKTVRVYLKDTEVRVQGASPFDIDCDGEVTLADITGLILIYLEKNPSTPDTDGDLDGDDDVTIEDITRLINYYLSLPQ